MQLDFQPGGSMHFTKSELGVTKVCLHCRPVMAWPSDLFPHLSSIHSVSEPESVFCLQGRWRTG